MLSSEEGLSASSSSLLYMFVQSCKVHASVHFNLFSRHWNVAVYKYAYKEAYTRGDLAQHLEQKNQTSIQVFYPKHPKSSRDHHQDEGYQER